MKNFPLLGFGIIGFAVGFFPAPDTTGDARHADRLVRAAVTALDEVPTDGRFGVSRVDLLTHNVGIPSSLRDVDTLESKRALNGHYHLGFMTFGKFDAKGMPGRIRSDLVLVNSARRTIHPQATELRAPGPTTLTKELARFYNSRQEAVRRELWLGNQRLWLDARVVKARKECVSCHSEVRVGRPIGVVALLQLSR